MTARHHVERTILWRHLADHQQGGDDVVIAVWGEKEILMPFHLGGGVRQLGVNFAVMKAVPLPPISCAAMVAIREFSAVW